MRGSGDFPKQTTVGKWISSGMAACVAWAQGFALVAMPCYAMHASSGYSCICTLHKVSILILYYNKKIWETPRS